MINVGSASNMTHYLIYKITNLVNGKFYIGKHITDNLEDNYWGSGLHIKRAIQKHGIENFVFTVLIDLKNEEELNLLEYLVVNEDFVKRPDTYNIKVGGKGGWPSTKGEKNPMYGHSVTEYMSDEDIVKWKANISKATSGDKHWNYGKHWSEEDKEKQRIAHLGQIPWNKGIPMSEESKKKLSINNGSKRQEVREKISKTATGTKWWNNGVIESHSKECPPGFVPGRLKRKKQ